MRGQLRIAALERRAQLSGHALQRLLGLVGIGAAHHEPAATDAAQRGAQAVGGNDAPLVALAQQRLLRRVQHRRHARVGVDGDQPAAQETQPPREGIVGQDHVVGAELAIARAHDVGTAAIHRFDRIVLHQPDVVRQRVGQSANQRGGLHEDVVHRVVAELVVVRAQLLAHRVAVQLGVRHAPVAILRQRRAQVPAAPLGGGGVVLAGQVPAAIETALLRQLRQPVQPGLVHGDLLARDLQRAVMPAHARVVGQVDQEARVASGRAFAGAAGVQHQDGFPRLQFSQPARGRQAGIACADDHMPEARLRRRGHARRARRQHGVPARAALVVRKSPRLP